MIKNQHIKSLLFFLVLLISLTGIELKAQTLIPDEVSLEKAVYANLQKGIAEFHGISEKHTFVISGKADVAKTIAALKEDKRVINATYDQKRTAFIITINKTSLNEARLWLQPMIESDNVKVTSHELQFFKKAD
jgi:hypothetical protein